MWSPTLPQTRSTAESGLISSEATSGPKDDGWIISIVLTIGVFGILALMFLGIDYMDLPVPDMILYNNTGREIEIHLGNEVKVVNKNSSGIVDQPMPCGAWIRRCQRGYRPFRVGTVVKKWTYEVVYPPQDYKKRWSSSRIEYRYQIEADGSIYLLKPDTEFPVSKLPSQPPGYPMVPQSTWGERAIILN